MDERLDPESRLSNHGPASDRGTRMLQLLLVVALAGAGLSFALPSYKTPRVAMETLSNVTSTGMLLSLIHI